VPKTFQLERPKNAVRLVEQPAEQARQLGGLIVLDFLMNLFGESPRQFFNRIDVLAVLEGVRNERTLFPEAVVARVDRIKMASKRTIN
jgi:hypothetical protein